MNTILVIIGILTGLFVYSFVSVCVHALFERKFFERYGLKFSDSIPPDYDNIIPITCTQQSDSACAAMLYSVMWPIYPFIYLVKFFVGKATMLHNKIVCYEHAGKALDKDAKSGGPYRQKEREIK